jgi:hypothetical protein
MTQGPTVGQPEIGEAWAKSSFVVFNVPITSCWMVRLKHDLGIFVGRQVKKAAFGVAGQRELQIPAFRCAHVFAPMVAQGTHAALLWQGILSNRWPGDVQQPTSEVIKITDFDWPIPDGVKPWATAHLRKP